MTRLVGLDIGTSSVKGLAMDQHGTVLTVVERGYQLSTPRPGWSEQDPEAWWRATETAEDVQQYVKDQVADGIIAAADTTTGPRARPA